MWAQEVVVTCLFIVIWVHVGTRRCGNMPIYSYMWTQDVVVTCLYIVIWLHVDTRRCGNVPIYSYMGTCGNKTLWQHAYI